jgi:hypothetical protein
MWVLLATLRYAAVELPDDLSDEPVWTAPTVRPRFGCSFGTPAFRHDFDDEIVSSILEIQ